MEKNSISDWTEAVCSVVRTVINKAKIKNIERKYSGNVDFWQHVDPSELSFNGKEGNPYSPSPLFIKKLCSKRRITEKDAIMDLGCGKGYALYVFGQFKFNKAIGVELDRTLADIAQSNISFIYGKDSSRFCIYNVDATRMMSDTLTREDFNRCNYFYIFNSFPPAIAEKVIEEIEDSINEAKRKVIIWYASPGKGCLDRLNYSSFFKQNKRYRFILYPRSGVYEFESIV